MSYAFNIYYNNHNLLQQSNIFKQLQNNIHSPASTFRQKYLISNICVQYDHLPFNILERLCKSLFQ